MSEFHTTTSNWSENIEKVISQIGISCDSYKWMSIYTAKRNEYKYNILMYTSIITGPVSGVLSIFSSSETATMFVTVFSFLSGIISTIIKFSEFGEKATLYKSVAAKYSSLENNIKRQLSLNREDRVNAGEYLEWISRSYDELFSTTPLIPDDIYQRFEKSHSLNSDVPVKQNSVEVEVKEQSHKFTTNNKVEFNTYSDGKMKYEMARLFKN
jgi:hypothetical protein